MTKKKKNPEQDEAKENAKASAADKEKPESEAKTEETAAPEAKDAQGSAPEQSEAEKKLAELQDSYMRLAAEYDNYRKHTQREREQLFGSVKASTIEALLPVYDNLARAAAQETSDEAFKKGVEMTLQQFDASLAALGVTEIESAPGTPFDPERHNAVMHVDDETLGESVVAETFQKGFETGGRVIRHAVVKVAN